MSSSRNDEWDIVISPRRGWLDIDLAGIWAYRDLIGLMVKRDFVAFYKQTILGPFWYLLQPLVTALVFTVVFGRIAGIPTDGMPPFLFFMAAVVPWSYFASCISKTSDVFTNYAGVFGKVYFPRLVVPIASVTTNLITFAIQFTLFLAVGAFYLARGADVHPDPVLFVLLVPALIVQMAALGLGVGILLSSLTTRYRDLTFLIGFGVQLWMYATPVVYPLSQVPESWRWAFAWNPMTGVIEGFRHALLGSGALDIGQIALGATLTALVLLVGVVMFTRIEKTSMDTV